MKLEFNARTLVFLRQNAGLTQPQLAEKLTVSEKTIRDWEACRSAPNPRNLTRLAEALEIDKPLLLLSDNDFIFHINAHTHPAELGGMIYHLVNRFRELSDSHDKDDIKTQLMIFDRLYPILSRAGGLSAGEPSEAQIENEKLIKGDPRDPEEFDGTENP